MPASKQLIADTFSRHVERFGYGKASVEGVAEELGISKRTIYQHFSSKRDLYAFVVGRIGEAERSRVEGELKRVRTYRRKMERFLRLVISAMRQHIAETSKADWMQEYEIAYDAMIGAYGSVAEALVSRGAEAGEFAMADGELANGLIAAMVTHYGVRVREDPSLDADEELVQAIMRMLGDGCAAGTHRAARGAARGRG